MKKLLPLLCLLATLHSCETDEIMIYEGDSNIYINEYYEDVLNPEYNQILDSTNFTFRATEETFRDFTLVIRLQGNLDSVDRPYLLTTDPATSNAIEGLDYVFLEPGDFVMRADSVTDTLTIRLLKNEDQLLKRISFRVEPNVHFGTNYQFYYPDFAGALPVSRIRHDFIFGDVPMMPLHWPDYEYIVGPYSAVKADLLVEIGFLEYDLLYLFVEPIWYWDIEIEDAAWLVQEYLDEQAAMGNPIFDENGNLVVMGL